MPSTAEIAADPIAVAAVAAAPSGSAPVSMGIGLQLFRGKNVSNRSICQ
jgi:hypothetical protein